MKLKLLAMACLLAVSTVASASTSFFQIIVDKTGSMSALRSTTGNTRWVDAISQAEKDLLIAIQESQEGGGTLKVAVATFESGGGYVQHLDYGSATQGQVVLSNLRNSSPGGGTNLADALCTGADQLFDESTIPPEKFKRVMGFYTDLGENASTGPCSGPNWTANVIQKFFSVFPGVPIFQITAFSTVDNLTTSKNKKIDFSKFDFDVEMREQSALYESLGLTLNKQQFALSEEVAFLTNLSAATGGYITGYADTQAEPPIGTNPNNPGGGCGVFFPCKK